MTGWDPRAPRARAPEAGRDVYSLLRPRRRSPGEGASWLTTHDDRVTVYPARRRVTRRLEWRWNVRAAGNGEITEQGESYLRREDAIDAARRHHP